MSVFILCYFILLLQYFSRGNIHIEPGPCVQDSALIQWPTGAPICSTFYFYFLIYQHIFYTSNILTAGLLFVAEYVHSFVLELLLSQLLKDLWLIGRHKNTSHHLNHTWLEDSESGWYLDCDWWFRSPQEHKYRQEWRTKVLQSLHVFCCWLW